MSTDNEWPSPAIVMNGQTVEVPLYMDNAPMRVLVEDWPHGRCVFHPESVYVGKEYNITLFSKWRIWESEEPMPPTQDRPPVVCLHCHESNQYGEPNRPDGTFLCFGCRPHAWRYEP